MNMDVDFMMNSNRASRWGEHVAHCHNVGWEAALTGSAGDGGDLSAV
jgi:hypothetical protein